jgi:RNA polymerase sigma factor for flagellar operon FliA
VTLPLIDEAEEAALWSELRGGGCAGARARLIDMHLPFARVMAAKMYAGRIGNEFEFDEYLQHATVALIECVDRYDPGYGASFRTYSSKRLVGAILNGMEHASEKHQQLAFRSRVAAERLESLREPCSPSDGPADLFAGLARMAVGLALGYVLEDSGMYRADEQATPDGTYRSIELRQLQERVRALVDNLGERERRIIRYHYLNQLQFDHIAEILGVSKGRVSQLHRRALDLLREEARRVKECDMAW